jgi:4-hydroxy-L-threonine phosphate dehydrogenase PdxA
LPEQKIIGITMGDAAGVGPEVVARALANIDMATDWRFRSDD